MPNRLQAETSPYLLEHAENPVDWHPWGAEAIEEARRRDVPIFLSIGYSACHWCHVMAHESFEDPQIARTLNAHFVPVKVDREERPDLDQLYMEAVQLMTGRGGWPLSVFLTPSLEPFFGGTYWPPRARGGMAGFDRVLRAVADVWQNRRQEAVQQAEKLTAVLRDDGLMDMVAAGALDEPLLEAAESELVRAADPDHGGFGSAPKFPQPMQLRFLLRRWFRTGRAELLAAVTTTLDRMAAGGIYDHLAGGFHRYATDAQWLVPHFEKMLYDNAMLASCYLEAWQATQNAEYARVVRETLDYVLRDMADPAGGFYSSEDADSEGEEGKFYLWAPEQLRSVLGPQAAATWGYVYDVSEAGNFEGANIFHRASTVAECAELLGRGAAGLEAELAESRATLLDARGRRVRPGRDTKVLVDWNGLAIDALAQAGRAMHQPRYVQSATAAADFLLANVRADDGRLLHCWSVGQARFHACLADYAALANSLVSLYEATFQERYVDEAVRLADTILSQFADPASGVFYLVGTGHEPLIARKTDLLDSSVPSGGGLATMALLRLGKLCGRGDYLAVAEAALRTAAPLMERAPMGTGQLLLALDLHLGPTPEIVLVGNGDQAAAEELLDEVFHGFLPSRIVAFREPSCASSGRSSALDAIFAGKAPLAPGPTLFLCENFACRSPVSGSGAVRAALGNVMKGAAGKPAG